MYNTGTITEPVDWNPHVASANQAVTSQDQPCYHVCRGRHLIYRLLGSKLPQQKSYLVAKIAELGSPLRVNLQDLSSDGTENPAWLTVIYLPH